MYAIDFEYDGRCLSDYGFMVCDFDYSSGIDVVDAGSQITFDKVPRNRGKSYSLVNSTYDSCITTTFDICKNPDIYNKDDMVITNDEYRDLMRWLNRRTFLEFRMISDNCDFDKERETCFYNASFNIEKLIVAGDLVGLRLTMESDKPFGYGQAITTKWVFSNTNTPKIISDLSDEVGYMYPDVTITVNRNGNLIIYNELMNCTTVINNCSVGEVITMKGQEQIIATTYSSHDIMDDFNFEFFKLGNTLDERNNKITVSIPCTMVITYAPIIKDTP